MSISMMDPYPTGIVKVPSLLTHYFCRDIVRYKAVEMIAVLKDDSEHCPHNLTETKSRKIR
jgi:hypothetical protein